MDHSNTSQHAKASLDHRTISLLLPRPGKYATASIQALIFLALEANPSLRTEKAIATEICKLTNGERNHSQSCISKNLRPMKEKYIHARNKTWKIEKFEEYYRLVNQEEARKHQAIKMLSSIPFDRSTVFQNSPANPTVFGFRFINTDALTPDHLSSAVTFFKDLLDGQYFHIQTHENILYVLLDCRNTYYTSAKDLLLKFIDEDFLTKRRR